jgi:hypothetical protein
VGSVGQVVHSGESGTRNIDALFVMLRWYQYRFDKKRARTHYIELMFLHPVGSVCDIVQSGESGS